MTLISVSSLSVLTDPLFHQVDYVTIPAATKINVNNEFLVIHSLKNKT